jgi:hypothetical protein
MVYAQARAEHIRLFLVRHNHFSERLARGRIKQAAMMIDLHRRLDHAVIDVYRRHVFHITQT